MIQRRTFPTEYPGCEIHVVTEQMPGGEWAVVATVQHLRAGATRTIDLPVPSERFPSQADAQDYGLRQATEWLDRNLPHEEKQSA
jgi:hypothetical protein